MIRLIYSSIIYCFVAGCSPTPNTANIPETTPNAPYIVVLGVAQDAGYPQTGCYEPHCLRAWNNHSLRRKTGSLGLVDPQSKKKWLFEATPDIKINFMN